MFVLNYRKYFWVLETVDDPSRADILWTHMQIDDEFQKAVGLQPHQYVNQFPLETCLVMKHNLAETVQKVGPCDLMGNKCSSNIITGK